MLGKGSADEMVYYENRILNFIINHQGEFGAEQIGKIFGFSKRNVQYFVKKYNKMGFCIESSKGRYIIKKFPEDFDLVEKAIEYKNVKKYTLYNILKEKISKGSIKRIDFVEGYSGENSPVARSVSHMQNMIHELEKDGVIYTKNGYLEVVENPIDGLDENKLLIILIYLSVMKNIYPRPAILDEIYKKILYKYNMTGKKYCDTIKVYPSKKKISMYDEIVLGTIENAINEEKSLKIRYRTESGIRNFLINPSGLIYNSQKDLWYLVSYSKRHSKYRLDRIIDVKALEGQLSDFKKELYEKSFEISDDDIVDVEVAFDREDFILSKLVSYKNTRKDSQIIDTVKEYILKDTMCGVGEFKKWVRSFGDSAVVLKPEVLRKQIIDDIKIMWERYGGYNG